MQLVVPRMSSVETCRCSPPPERSMVTWIWEMAHRQSKKNQHWSLKKEKEFGRREALQKFKTKENWALLSIIIISIIVVIKNNNKYNH